MTQFTILALLIAFAAGCGEPTEQLPLTGPLAVVWNIYKSQSAPPGFVWHEDWCLENGIQRRAFLSQGTCVVGLYSPGENIELERTSSYYSNASSDDEGGYAHELMHAHQWLDYGITDPDHSSDAWRPGGKVDDANEALLINGY